MNTPTLAIGTVPPHQGVAGQPGTFVVERAASPLQEMYSAGTTTKTVVVVRVRWSVVVAVRTAQVVEVVVVPRSTAQDAGKMGFEPTLL